ncbi:MULTISPECIES: TetR/AcrR family transcriptional regulator [unclassified Crossiella]|uniref:TetR/AcrR family transcriptional regulator n=1 Tax=unclassified Crossiella TaxID=2620835 RepID=UPI001FFEE74B|nr:MULTISPECIES: TetR/AcrR family transcriptional regulator [unclassified Crossiella]MCK2241525.1 TetR family transcriptional regulator [Crossiella sp. S99.2]MCK2255603.1 TetR family transcriptional regulator [Crossiella sp. S99.1]
MARIADRAEQGRRISAAVWRLMAETGPQGLTLRAVAAAAGCTTGLVLHRFPDKRALLRHARDLLHERTGAAMDELTGAGGSPAAVLRAVLRHAASVDPAKQQEARVWLGYLAAALGDDDLADRHRSANRAFLSRIDRLVGQVRPQWTKARRATVSLSLVSLIEGMNTLAVADPETYRPTRQIAVLDSTLAALDLTDPPA